MEASELRLKNLVTVNNPECWPKLKNVVLAVTTISERDELYKYAIGLSHINKQPNTYYQEYSQFIKYIDPLPISEKLLLMFDFEKWGKRVVNEFEYRIEYCLHNVIEGTSDFKVCKAVSNYGTPGEKTFEIWIICIDDDSVYLKDLKHIHQVQNYFQCIQGYDLELKKKL